MNFRTESLLKNRTFVPVSIIALGIIFISVLFAGAAGTAHGDSKNSSGDDKKEVFEKRNRDKQNQKRISFDSGSSNYSSTPGSSITTPHTVSGKNRLLLVSVSLAQGGSGLIGDLVTGITYDGVPMAIIDKVETHAGNTNPIESYLYYLVAPHTGTHNVVVSYGPLAGVSQYVWISSASYTGAKQSAPEVVFKSEPNQGAPLTVSITTVIDGSMVVMGSYSDDGGTSGGADTTIRSVSPVLDRQIISDNGVPKAHSGNVTLNINQSPLTTYNSWIATAIAPAK